MYIWSKNFSLTKFRCKTIAVFFLLMLMALFCCTHAYAAVYIPKVLSDIYVYDSADILSDETERIVNEKLDKLEEDTTIEIAVITIPSLGGMPIEDYANEEFNTLGIGKADQNNGVLLLISTEEPRVRIEVGRGLEGTLTDSRSGRILDNYFVEYRAKGDYDTGVRETVDAISKIVSGEKVTGVSSAEDNWGNIKSWSIGQWVMAILYLLVYTLPYSVLLLLGFLSFLEVICEWIVQTCQDVYEWIVYHAIRRDKLPEYKAERQQRIEKREEQRLKKKIEREKHKYYSSSGSSSSSSGGSSWSSWGSSSASFGGGSSGGGGASR